MTVFCKVIRYLAGDTGGGRAQPARSRNAKAPSRSKSAQAAQRSKRAGGPALRGTTTAAGSDQLNRPAWQVRALN
jgi:hypothetical protein